MSSQSKHVLAGKRIIISGAGIAGLTFAKALDLNWPSGHPKPEVIIYERSARHNGKSNDGYTIGIRAPAGLAALHRIGLLQTALDHSTTSLDHTDAAPTMWAKDWSELAHFSVHSKPKNLPEGSPAFIRLVRRTLHEILLNSLPKETNIQWERACESVRMLGNGRTEVTLSDGTIDTCDLLIAADGAHSKIRTQLLPEEKLDFLGIVCYLGTSKFPEGKPAPTDKRWGITFSGQGVPFLNFPIDSTTGVWATSHRSPPIKRIKGYEAVKHRDEVLQKAHDLCRSIGNPAHQFIDATDPETLSVFNAEQKYPFRHSEKVKNANIVFMGDANHPMSPFSGNGANMALMDGVELAVQLSKHEASVQAAIDAFDDESMPRSKSAIDKAKYTIALLHSQGWFFVIVRAFFALVRVILRLKG